MSGVEVKGSLKSYDEIQAQLLKVQVLLSGFSALLRAASGDNVKPGDMDTALSAMGIVLDQTSFEVSGLFDDAMLRRKVEEGVPAEAQPNPWGTNEEGF